MPKQSTFSADDFISRQQQMANKMLEDIDYTANKNPLASAVMAAAAGAEAGARLPVSSGAAAALLPLITGAGTGVAAEQQRQQANMEQSLMAYKMAEQSLDMMPIGRFSPEMEQAGLGDIPVGMATRLSSMINMSARQRAQFVSGTPEDVEYVQTMLNEVGANDKKPADFIGTNWVNFRQYIKTVERGNRVSESVARRTFTVEQPVADEVWMKVNPERVGEPMQAFMMEFYIKNNPQRFTDAEMRAYLDKIQLYGAALMSGLGQSAREIKPYAEEAIAGAAQIMQSEGRNKQVAKPKKPTPAETRKKLEQAFGK